MSSDNYQNLPHVYLQEGQRLEVYESRNIWGRKKTTYRVVQDTGDSAYGIWVLIILMLLAVAGFVFFKNGNSSQESNSKHQVNHVIMKK